MATTQIPARTRTRLEALAHRGLDSFTFREQAVPVLRDGLRFDAAWWWTLDPASGFFTSGVFDPVPTDHAICRGLHANEYGDSDYNKFRMLARSRDPAGVLGIATGGRPELSERHREILTPLGYGAELRMALGDGTTVWGGLALLRDADAPDFTTAEAHAVASLAQTLMLGLRLGIVVGAPAPGAAPGGPGVLLLDEAGSVVMSTPGAERWLEEIGNPTMHGLPEPVHAVMLAAAGDASGAARVRLRTADGRWVTLHASRATASDASPAHTAVVIEQASPAEIAPLIIEGYGLSPGEARVTRLVLQGLSTKEIAGALHLSPYTVQDHLKAIFTKVRVRSRRDLVARIFDQYHWPRFNYGVEHPEADGAVAGAYRADETPA